MGEYQLKTMSWMTSLALDAPEKGFSSAQLMLINHDLKPVEKERRQWGARHFVALWVADAFNINTWMIASSMIISGLSWWQAWICVWIGYSFSGSFIVLTGRIGATYHIGFPVIVRASFGIWGSLWPILNRAVMACIWYGVTSYLGGHCVYLMIRSIWKSWDGAKMPGNFGTDATNTPLYVSFIIFWVLSLPALWFPVQKMRHLFTFKAFFVPAAGVSFLIWAVVRAGGVGPIMRQSGSLSGSKLAWAMTSGVMSSISNFATLVINDSDFTRFARTPRDAILSQLICIPVSFALISFVGIIVTSSSAIIFGEPIWDPLVLLGRFIDGGGPAERFGVFVIALAFAVAQLGSNVAANSVSAGSDLTALLPRYINIRRGSYICAIAGLAMCPYNLLTASNKFTTWLSAYSVFLSAIAGVMASDYYVVRKGYLKTKELYHGRRDGPYYYTFGINWRAYVAYIAGILINVVGFAGAVGANVPMGAIYIYNLNFFCGFIVTFAGYFAICKLSPVPATKPKWMEAGDIDDTIDETPSYASPGPDLDTENSQH